MNDPNLNFEIYAFQSPQKAVTPYYTLQTYFLMLAILSQSIIAITGKPSQLIRNGHKVDKK